MIGANLITNMALALVLVAGVLCFLALRQYRARRRIRNYTGGMMPETLDFGVNFYGYSTDKGHLRRQKGVIFATSEALVFIGRKHRSEIVEMTWDHLKGWSVVGEFRGRPMDIKVLCLRLAGDIGLPMDLAFSVPRPEFWTRLIDIAIKSC